MTALESVSLNVHPLEEGIEERNKTNKKKRKDQKKSERN